MALPSKGLPTASQVAEWARWMADNRKGVDIDGNWGFQCWDLPNYIFSRYWGFRTWGNANAMANRSQYPAGFKIYANTPNFIPRPGDVAVYTGGAFGHTNVVVGPSTTSYFYAVDQNWDPVSTYYGSRALLVKHNYNDGPGGVRYFVRPPYKAEPKNSSSDNKDDTKPTTPTTPTTPPKEDDKNKTVTVKKDQKEIKFTISDDDTIYPDFIPHRIVRGKERGHSPTKLVIRNANTMCSVQDLYYDRRKYIKDAEYPHYYVDRNHIWQPRREMYEVPSHPDGLVVEVCGDFSDSKNDFILNEIHAMIEAVARMKFHNIPLKESSIDIDDQIWRSVLEHGEWNSVLKGKPPQKALDKTAQSLIYIYEHRKEFLSNIPKDKITKRTVKVDVPASSVKDDDNKPGTTTGGSTTSKPTKPTATNKEIKTIIVYSKYTFAQAVNIQMTRSPQINYGSGWYGASRAATLNAMNSLEIWNSSTQKYQMLNLGKYQGISVNSLNKILAGKGSLSGQGQAFADACKKYRLNEIYLIAHAFLESGYGTSNFASGSWGAFNYFGIGAFDSNPNYAMTLAKNKGWTTPAKAIIGGAQFVREGYINEGQDTLYRMRWNPQNPGTHQYATDVRWAQVQATTIKNLYDKIGIRGEYFIRDKYKA